MADKRVLFLWEVPEAVQARLRERLRHLPLTLDFIEREETALQLERAPGASVLVGWKYDDALLDAARDCEVCINPGAGVQHLLKLWRSRAERAPTLVNGHGNAALTAQGTVALLLALTNRVAEHDRIMRAGGWDREWVEDRAPSRSLYARRLGLLGYGHVNRHVHRLLSGFSMETHVLRRRPQGIDGARVHVELATFLDAVDTLVIAVPRTRETDGLIDEAALERLGPDGLLVNVARGGVVSEEALFQALKQGIVAGAALDVWYDYRPAPDAEGRRYPYTQPFHELDNVVLSPHRAASPFDDLDRWDDVANNLKRFATGEPLENVVDLEAGY